jgi:hypothetical protein
VSPTARSLSLLRRQGYLAAPVERYIPQVQKKLDLFGVADVLAVHPRDRVVLLVQATSADHVSDRLARVRARTETALLLRAGVQVEVWGWRKSDGGKWEVRRVAVRPGDLAAVELTPKRPRRGRRPVQMSLFPAD